ncbi:MAG: LuxR C-terminal-related transcriptional regulator [Actinomycetota bacterium]|nr:LuxR C-terminal-related transcriptional regulator [Actinomycetota bacterium]
MDQADPAEELAATKLRPPVLPRGLVRRAPLVDALDAATDGRTRLVLVSAPAGAGKSTLVGSWAAGRPDGSVAWFQVEDADADPARFWAYVTLALDRVVAGVADRVLPAVRASGGDAAVVVPRLVNALDAHAGAITLVVDDYHLIDAPVVHEGFERFLELAPPHVLVVVATRLDPPFRLGRLRVRRELVDIRARDLRFEGADAAALVGVAGNDAPGSGATVNGTAGIDDAEVERLVARTEGWAAGLVLAGLSLGAGGGFAGFENGDRLVAEYLTDELLDALDDDDRHRMLRTAILDRLAGPLVDAVCGTTDGAAWLHRLAGVNQLVIGLDGSGTWFRYHHLLRDVLRAEAGRVITGELDGLHLRAADWFESTGRAVDAIDHTLAAGDRARAAALLASQATTLLNAGQFTTLVRYLGAVGEAADHNVGCAALAGWLALSQGSWDDGARWLLRAIELADGDAAHPEVAPLAITASLTSGDVATGLTIARTVHDRGDHTRTARLAMMVGGAFVLGGDPARAAGPLAEAAALAEREPDHYVAVVTPVFGAMAAVELGDRGRATRLAEQSIALAVEVAHEDAPLACLAMSALGRVSDDPEWAAGLVRRGAELAARSPDNLFLAYAHTCAGEVLCAAGEPDGPDHLVEARRVVAGCRDPGSVGADLARIEARHRVASASAPDPVPELVEEPTDRELAVLRYLPSGLSQREIAAELYVSINTVKTHTRGLYRKLGVTDRREAIHRARRLGLL